MPWLHCKENKAVKPEEASGDMPAGVDEQLYFPHPHQKKQQTKEEIRWIAFRLASTQLNCLLKCYCNSTAVGEVAPQVGLFLYCASCAAHPVLVAVTPC